MKVRMLATDKGRNEYERMAGNNFLKNKLGPFYYPYYKGFIPLPSIIMVEPTSACNLKCAICFVQQRIKEKYYLSLNEFKGILAQFPKIKELIFCGIGEPLLNKDIFGMINAAKERKVGFVNLFTNGKLLSPQINEEILRSEVSRVQISVHSFKADIFSNIRNEDALNLETLKKNIRHLVAAKKDLNSSLKVCCNAVVTKFNYVDLSDFLKDAHLLGVDRVEFFQLTTANNNLKDVNAPLRYMPAIIKSIRRLAHRLSIEVGFLTGNDYGRCYQLWDFVMIHADGNISPCNGIFPTENMGLGNILQNHIETIWNSEGYHSLRQLVKKGQLKYCKYCESGYCLGGKDWRWFKNYYLRPLKRLIKSVYGKN